MQNEGVCSLQPAACLIRQFANWPRRVIKKCSVHRPSLAGARDWQIEAKRRTGGLALAELLVGRPPDPPTLFRQAQKTTLAHFSA